MRFMLNGSGRVRFSAPVIRLSGAREITGALKRVLQERVGPQRRVRFSGPVTLFSSGEVTGPLKRTLQGLSVLLVLLVGSSSFAQDDWTLTTADFQSHRVTLAAVGDSGIQVIESGKAATIPLDQFLDLDRTVTTPASPSMIVYLIGGDRLTGMPLGIKDEQLQWKQPLLGEVKLPLKRIVAIAKAGQNPPREDEARTEDVATLANGDTVHGIVGTLTSDSATISANGQDVPVPLSSINVLSFASTGEAKPPPPARGFRVSLADGSAFTGTKIELQKDSLRLTPGTGDARSIPLPSVARIEQINGPVSWLVSRTPTENVQIPYFASQTQPAKMGLSVDGQPIRVGDKTYPHSIGVHSYSRLVYALDPAYKTFRTEYAIDGNLPYANVTIRIKLDAKVVHEQKDVTTNTPLKPVVLELNGAKQLTLEVDYGKTYDVQDRLNWIEPALLKTAPPASTPSTQP
jgi:hypothetical protein